MYKAMFVLCVALNGASEAQPSKIYPDLTGDCVIDMFDVMAVSSASNDPRSDLNFDGIVDMLDVELVVQNVGTTRKFTNHWGVWTIAPMTPWNYPMSNHVPLTGTKVSTNFAFLHQGAGLIPESLHEMFWTDLNLDGKVDSKECDNWQTTFSAWLVTHNLFAKIAIEAMVPVNLPPQQTFTTIFDYEKWEPVWEANQDPEGEDFHRTMWTACLKDIHMPLFDTEFLDQVGYTPPVGTKKWNDLPLVQKEILLKQSWDHFARVIYQDTIDQFRELRPQNRYKLGFHNTPARCGGKTCPVERLAWNDQMAWLWPQIDVLCPSMYAAWWIEDGTTPDPCIMSFKGTKYTADVIAGNLAECWRVRDTYSAGAAVVPVLTWSHTGRAAGGSTATSQCKVAAQDAIVSSTSAYFYLWICKMYGADGTIIWGTLRDETLNVPYLKRQDPMIVAPHLEENWFPLINDITCN